MLVRGGRSDKPNCSSVCLGPSNHGDYSGPDSRLGAEAVSLLTSGAVTSNGRDAGWKQQLDKGLEMQTVWRVWESERSRGWSTGQDGRVLGGEVGREVGSGKLWWPFKEGLWLSH